MGLAHKWAECISAAVDVVGVTVVEDVCLGICVCDFFATHKEQNSNNSNITNDHHSHTDPHTMTMMHKHLI